MATGFPGGLIVPALQSPSATATATATVQTMTMRLMLQTRQHRRRASFHVEDVGKVVVVYR